MPSTLTRRSLLSLAAACAALVPLAACSSGGAPAAQDPSGSSAGGAPSDGQDASAQADYVSGVADDDPFASGVHHVVIEVADFGTIEATLNAQAAPVTVSNFCHLVQDGFYDGLTFHRVIEGFMIQGGDPNGDGTGGSSTRIVGEFSANGIDNPITHRRGTLSMARSSDYNSASSQFFIMQRDNSSLDGLYAAFGTVNEGIEVVDAIAEQTPVQDDNGTVAPADQPTIASITVTD